MNKHIVHKIKHKSSELKKEFKKQSATAIIAAFGLIIATAWKEVIFNTIHDLLGTKLTTSSPGLAALIAAISLTLIGTLGILMISRWYQKEDPQTVISVSK